MVSTVSCADLVLLDSEIFGRMLDQTQRDIVPVVAYPKTDGRVDRTSDFEIEKA